MVNKPTNAVRAKPKAAGARLRRSKPAVSSKRTPREAGRLAVVDRAVKLLVGIAQSPEPVTLNEAARYAGLSKATAFRILATMIDQGMVEQDSDTASYRLGTGPLRLATAVLDSIDVHAAARPVMRTVCDMLNETVVLSVRDGDFRVNIDAAECTNAIGSSRRIGERRPLHAGAASLVLLAALPDAEIEAYTARHKEAGGPAWRAQFMKDIARVRRTGLASVKQEMTIQTPAIATPVKGPDGQVLAALHVAIPTPRFTAKLEDRCGAALLRAAADIERVLSGKP